MIPQGLRCDDDDYRIGFAIDAEERSEYRKAHGRGSMLLEHAMDLILREMPGMTEEGLGSFVDEVRTMVEACGKWLPGVSLENVLERMSKDVPVVLSEFGISGGFVGMDADWVYVKWSAFLDEKLAFLKKAGSTCESERMKIPRRLAEHLVWLARWVPEIVIDSGVCERRVKAWTDRGVAKRTWGTRLMTLERLLVSYAVPERRFERHGMLWLADIRIRRRLDEVGDLIGCADLTKREIVRACLDKMDDPTAVRKRILDEFVREVVASERKRVGDPDYEIPF